MNDQKQLISSLGEEMTIRQKRTMIFFIEATKHILKDFSKVICLPLGQSLLP